MCVLCVGLCCIFCDIGLHYRIEFTQWNKQKWTEIIVLHEFGYKSNAFSRLLKINRANTLYIIVEGHYTGNRRVSATWKTLDNRTSIEWVHLYVNMKWNTNQYLFHNTVEYFLDISLRTKFVMNVHSEISRLYLMIISGLLNIYMTNYQGSVFTIILSGVFSWDGPWLARKRR